MAKNHFSEVQNCSQSVQMGVLGGVFVLKSGLRILIQAPQVPFSVPPKRPKWVFWSSSLLVLPNVFGPPGRLLALLDFKDRAIMCVMFLPA